MKRRELLLALGCAPALAHAQPARDTAEAWPTRPVKLIVPFAPGGPTDVIARLVAERVQTGWRQPVVLEYKPGAGTVVGTQFVATSPADGYTLGMAISALMVNPSLQPKLPYDTAKDLAGVSQLALSHFGLFAHPSLPVANLAELIAYGKKNPGKLSYATPGTGTGTHLAGEMLNQMAGLDMVHVPYKGSVPAQQDVIGGRVPLLFDVMFSALPFVRDGRLRSLALASPRRAESNPDIPLISESLPGFSAMSIIGIIAPRAAPRELVRRISADIARAVRSPEVRERFAQLGTEAVGSTPEEYDALIKSEIDKWAAVVKSRGIKIE
ncbi:MAG: tripartite tricarboxylate transporter substrate binding protein [Burkholderiales bacterium]|nr:tripartite tricarboxylate transporter substrate binding protein [Burkholderiales bacterium]